MEERNQMIAMLELMLRPAFCVEAGQICHINPAAAGYLLEPGTAVAPLIRTGAQEYKEFAGGCLYLTLELGGQPLGVSVVRKGRWDLFFPEPQDDPAELRAMALAAGELREPLSGILAATDRLFPAISSGEDPAAREQTALINRRLFQMMRMLYNMSDAYQYSRQSSGRTEYIEADSFFRELFEKTAVLLEAAGLSVHYEGLCETVYTLAEPDRLERAILNLISNAAKFAPQDSCIQAKLIRRGQRLSLSLTSPDDEDISTDPFNRFRRAPALEDRRKGIGLGLVLVRATAAAHGGALLIDQPEPGLRRVTMTLSVRQSREAELRSPSFRLDYAGGWDHALLELSDCLPPALYAADQLK